MRAPPVTLVYAARDPEHNHALALRDYLLDADRGEVRAEYASPPCFLHEIDPDWAGPEPRRTSERK